MTPRRALGTRPLAVLALVAVTAAGGSLGAAGLGPREPLVAAQAVDLTADEPVATPSAAPEVPSARSVQAASRAAEREEREAVHRADLAADVRATVAEQHRLAAEEQRLAAEAAAAAQAEAARLAEEAARLAEEAARQAAVDAAAADPRAAARALVTERGWGEEQFRCLDSLWTRESGWQHTADNPTSSAYGIPQALPGHKMASAGPDWASNPLTQITWGLGYIADVYGTPCGAWAHSESHNWY